MSGKVFSPRFQVSKRTVEMEIRDSSTLYQILNLSIPWNAVSRFDSSSGPRIQSSLSYLTNKVLLKGFGMRSCPLGSSSMIQIERLSNLRNWWCSEVLALISLPLFEIQRSFISPSKQAHRTLKWFTTWSRLFKDSPSPKDLRPKSPYFIYC
jgi:hypothetical protein